MSCEEIKNLLDEYIEGELSSDEAELVGEHLKTCEVCAAEYERLKALKTELKALAEPVPIGFEDRLRAKLKSQRRHFKLAANTFAVTAAAAVVLICVVVLNKNGSYQDELEIKRTEVSNAIAETSTEQTTAENKTAAITEQLTQAQQMTVSEPVNEATTAQQTTVSEPVNEATTAQQATVSEPKGELTTSQIKAATETTTANEQWEQLAADTAELATVYEDEEDAVGGSSPQTEASNEMSADTDTDEGIYLTDTDTDESVYSADNPTLVGGMESDVNFTLVSGDMRAIGNIFRQMSGVSDLSYSEDGLTAEIDGIALSELRKLLADFDLEDDEVYVDEDETSYSFAIWKA